MRTFDAFVEERLVAKKICEAAELMVNVEDPCVFLQTWYEQNEPELAALLIEAGFWQGMKDAGSQIMGGVRAGAQAFARQAWGPQAKFDSAAKALGDLNTLLDKDPNLRTWAGTNGNHLINQIGRMVQYLNKLKPTIPQVHAQQATNTWANPATPGSIPGANAASGGTIPHPAAAHP